MIQCLEMSSAVEIAVQMFLSLEKIRPARKDCSLWDPPPGLDILEPLALIVGCLDSLICIFDVCCDHSYYESFDQTHQSLNLGQEYYYMETRKPAPFEITSEETHCDLFHGTHNAAAGGTWIPRLSPVGGRLFSFSKRRSARNLFDEKKKKEVDPALTCSVVLSDILDVGQSLWTGDSKNHLSADPSKKELDRSTIIARACVEVLCAVTV
ncbi:unnamed protein product [Cyprideis torosa]|uniref:Uncharacterized protein n=1 Tax=Cyprideis torosa TaxID=163714 RepID=A0A7R8WD81_9CRUS|nr:unnamed protein product [Cyprideis torosa]CAG0888096.1 unnamed protein product [Cyprideis torosa]